MHPVDGFEIFTAEFVVDFGYIRQPRVTQNDSDIREKHIVRIGGIVRHLISVVYNNDVRIFN